MEEQRQDQAGGGIDPSVTVYHLTSSGQGPDIDIYHLPCQTIRFLRAVRRAGTAHVWQGIRAAAWERKQGEQGTGGGDTTKRRRRPRKDPGSAAAQAWGPEISRNFLYEDLFDLPATAARFVRTYFLRRAYQYAREGDPRREYSLGRQRDLICWEITALFLREVIGMDKGRIEAIRTLGDRIAAHIASENDRRLFQGFYRSNQYRGLRNLLIKASSVRLKKGQAPLIGFDEFLQVFEEGEESARVDWARARDLVLIRVIEELHGQEWFGKQPDVLEALATEEEAEGSEAVVS